MTASQGWEGERKAQLRDFFLSRRAAPRGLPLFRNASAAPRVFFSSSGSAHLFGTASLPHERSQGKCKFLMRSPGDIFSDYSMRVCGRASSHRHRHQCPALPCPVLNDPLLTLESPELNSRPPNPAGSDGESQPLDLRFFTCHPACRAPYPFLCCARIQSLCFVLVQYR